MDRLPPDPWVEVKRAELLEAIRCAAESGSRPSPIGRPWPPGQGHVTASSWPGLEPAVTLRGFAVNPPWRPGPATGPSRNQPVKETSASPFQAPPVTQPTGSGMEARSTLHAAGPGRGRPAGGTARLVRDVQIAGGCAIRPHGARPVTDSGTRCWVRSNNLWRSCRSHGEPRGSGCSHGGPDNTGDRPVHRAGRSRRRGGSCCRRPARWRIEPAEILSRLPSP